MIPLFKVWMSPEVKEPLLDVLYGGYITQGPQVEKFESDLKSYLEVDNLLTVNAGTSALQLALYLAGVRHGDRVISTPMTCSATNTAIIAVGGKILWSDINPLTGNISSNSVEDLLRSNRYSNIKAIMAVHWGGYPCDIDELNYLGNKYNVKIIEDAAHAFGASYKGLKIGRHSDFVCFSPRTLVTTDLGSKQIQHIKIGDKVLTESGKFEKVLFVHKNLNTGKWARIWVGKKSNETALSGTENHPIKVYRNGIDDWIPMKNILVGDYVYVETVKCKNCANLIPHYHKYCKNCEQTNKTYEMKTYFSTLAKSKSLKKRPTSQSLHYYNDILPKAEQLIKEGNYDSIVPIGRCIPDIIGVKDGKIYAIEVENKVTPRLSKELKYKEVEKYYEDVVWITKESRLTKRKQKYEIVGNLARVPVVRKEYFNNESSACKYVYNLTVDNNSTYFARKILVHNCFSFQAIKHLSTVDGGALVCKNDKDHKRGKVLRWFGIDRDQPRQDFRCELDIPEAGWKYHMNDVNAVIGIHQLPSVISKIIPTHQDNGLYYDKEIVGIPGIHNSPKHADRLSSYWLYTLLSENRPKFMKFMEEKGVVTSQVHSRNDTHSMCAEFVRELPGVDNFTANQVNIPVGWWVSNTDREYIVDCIKKYTYGG